MTSVLSWKKGAVFSEDMGNADVTLSGKENGTVTVLNSFFLLQFLSKEQIYILVTVTLCFCKFFDLNRLKAFASMPDSGFC